MVDESDIRSHLTGGETPTITIDIDAVVAKSRARRRPRQLAVGAVGVLAVASLVFAGVGTLPRAGDLTPASSMADQSTTRLDSDAGADTSESSLAPDAVYDSERCGVMIPSQAASPYGLAVTVDLPSPMMASGSTFGFVRLTNTSDIAVTGDTAAVPEVNLTRDGLSLSHSPDAQILSVTPITLQPGQSMDFDVSLNIYDCTTISTGGMLEPGVYTVTASLAFVPDDSGTATTAEIRSSPTTIVLQ